MNRDSFMVRKDDVTKCKPYMEQDHRITLLNMQRNRQKQNHLSLRV